MRRNTAPQSSQPSLGRPKDAAKRDGIIRAASALFMGEGFAATSMEAVAKKADVSKLTIYSHFANKDDLFREVIQQRCQKLAMPERYLAFVDMEPEKALVEFGLTFVNLIFSTDSVRMHRVILAEAQRNPQVAEIFYSAGPKRVRAAFGELLKEWNRLKKLSVPDYAKATEQFMSLLKGELLMRVVLGRAPPPSARELNKHVHTTVAFFLSAAKPKN